MSEAPSCPDSETRAPGCRLGALYWACVHNDSAQLQAVLDGGVSPEEATQVDGNGRVSYPRCFPGQLWVRAPHIHPESAGASGRKERARAGLLWGSVGLAGPGNQGPLGKARG